MITITKEVTLKEIDSNNYQELYSLMNEIYPPEYHHFWKDAGIWYINNQYSKENFIKEITAKNQLYYFVNYKDETVGILRILLDVPMKKLPNEKSVKLHRIYLNPTVQGKGIGKQLITYVKELTRSKGYSILWLEAMEKKPKAISFYKKENFQKADEYLYEFDLLKKEYQKMLAIYVRV